MAPLALRTRIGGLLRFRWSVVLALTFFLVGPLVPAAASGGAGPYYVAIGASESLGVQPTSLDPHGQPTDHGYANDLLSLERRRWPGLRLVQIGCPGLTVPQAVDGGGRCRFAGGSELATAVAFLRSHRDSTVLVTVDLGFNDLRPCFERFAVDQRCVKVALAGIETTLPVVLGRLVAAAGPQAHIVGLRHNDPFEADAARRPTEQFSDVTAAVLSELNQELQAIYSRSRVLTADSPRAFSEAVRRMVSAGSPGARGACALTWMCVKPPFGPNLHPNTLGYHLIADSIASALDRDLGPPG